MLQYSDVHVQGDEQRMTAMVSDLAELFAQVYDGFPRVTKHSKTKHQILRKMAEIQTAPPLTPDQPHAASAAAVRQKANAAVTAVSPVSPTTAIRAGPHTQYAAAAPVAIRGPMAEQEAMTLRLSTRIQEAATIHDVTHMPEVGLIAAARSDQTIAFFKDGEGFEVAGSAVTGAQQYMLAWDGVSQRLFTVGGSASIAVWELDRTNEVETGLGLRRIATLTKHTDVVLALLAVRDDDVEGGHCIVSAALDRKVYLWDADKLEYMACKVGNTAAIKSLSFDPHDNLLVGGGYEGSLLCWDLWGKLGLPLFKLPGHRVCVTHVACIPRKGRLVSMDEDGRLLLWDCRRVFDVTDPRSAEPPLSCALFNATCNSFVTCNAGWVTLWDASSGALLRSRQAMDQDITCAVWDGCQRKLLLGGGDGAITVYNFLKGTVLRTLPPSTAAVTAMAYSSEDKVGTDLTSFGSCGGSPPVVTAGVAVDPAAVEVLFVLAVIGGKRTRCYVMAVAGWDRRIRVIDEVASERDDPLLRLIDGAHDADMTCLALSHPLGLIATGAADGSLKHYCDIWKHTIALKLLCHHDQHHALAHFRRQHGMRKDIWDFQFLYLEGDATPSLAGAEVLCTIFVDPYPLLVAGDSAGFIYLVPVRPWLGGNGAAARDRAALRFQNDTRSGSPTDGAAAVTTLDVHYFADAGPTIGRGIRSGRHVLFVGDESGIVRAWDLQPCLQSLGMHAAPEAALPRSKNNYNPRRRLHSTGASQVDRRVSAASSILHCSTGASQADRRVSAASSASFSTVGQGGPGLSTEMAKGADALRPAGRHASVVDRRSFKHDSVSSRDKRRATATTAAAAAANAACIAATGDAGPPRPLEGVSPLAVWAAHDEGVVSLQVIQDPPCLMTASSDRSVKLWRLISGRGKAPQRISTLTHGRQKDARRQDAFRFPADSGERQRMRLAEATQLLDMRYWSRRDNTWAKKAPGAEEAAEAARKAKAAKERGAAAKEEEKKRVRALYGNYFRELERAAVAEAAMGATLREKKALRLAELLNPSAFLLAHLPELKDGILQSHKRKHRHPHHVDVERLLLTHSSSSADKSASRSLTKNGSQSDVEQSTEAAAPWCGEDAHFEHFPENRDCSQEHSAVDAPQGTCAFSPDKAASLGPSVVFTDDGQVHVNHGHKCGAAGSPKDPQKSGQRFRRQRSDRLPAPAPQSDEPEQQDDLDSGLGVLVGGGDTCFDLGPSDGASAEMLAARRQLQRARSNACAPLPAITNLQREYSRLKTASLMPLSRSASEGFLQGLRGEGGSVPLQIQLPRRPGAVTLADLIAMAQRQAEVQARWRYKVAAFVTRLEKHGGRPRSGPAPGDKDTTGDKNDTAQQKQQPERPPWEQREARMAARAAKLRTRMHFGPYHVDELAAALHAFRAVCDEGGRADVRSLYRAKELRTHKAQMQELLISAPRGGAVPVTLDDFLRRLFPQMRRFERKDFHALVHIWEEEAPHDKRSKSAASGAKRAPRVSEQQLADLKALFDIYDTDGSGCVDTGELLRALDTRYDHHRYRTSASPRGSSAEERTQKSPSEAMQLEGAMPCQEAAAVSKLELIELVRAVDEDGNGELNFDEFVELFKDVF
ncbi:hypothetical protein JKP88DRAFT_245988 [Tribonema minus]|uniref:EF-hand domain-containing protein n=1 Tax=Tribonema minus TaxID=303371 RepID=A0A835YW79_9STRA|nr:hypothetical protein JKP88DRAFT_245988 [Tribonema minus]